ncbi:unnamed protein product, partial [Brassica rapa]
MYYVTSFDVTRYGFFFCFGQENLRIRGFKSVKALETPGVSKELHRLERHLQWTVN